MGEWGEGSVLREGGVEDSQTDFVARLRMYSRHSHTHTLTHAQLAAFGAKWRVGIEA